MYDNITVRRGHFKISLLLEGMSNDLERFRAPEDEMKMGLFPSTNLVKDGPQ